MTNIIGIDAGGTFLKAGNPSLHNLHSTALPYTKESVNNIIRGYKEIILTGAGSQNIKQWFDSKINNEINFKIYNEFKSTGFGGAYLSSVDNGCIVINIGSGTPILYVDKNNNEVVHLGGTGLGSASLSGLAHFIIKNDNLTQISELALKGDPNKVNLLVGDLYENSEKILGLPHDITASNFGKYQKWRHVNEKPNKNDILAGLHVMVAESIAVIANQASKKYNDHVPIVLTGGGTLNPALVKYLKKTFLFLNKECIIPKNAMYATLYGLFVLNNTLD